MAPNAGAPADDCIKAHLISSGKPWAYLCGVPKAGVELLEAALPNGAVPLLKAVRPKPEAGLLLCIALPKPKSGLEL